MRSFFLFIPKDSAASGAELSYIFLGLKVLNEWPTFPQLIVNGELVGGLDIVTEMADNGELEELMK